MPFDLTALETRVLGCLLEKERLTPDIYPLSLNSLTAACNQVTNRDPVTSYSEKEVEDGLFGLRDKKLATMSQMAGSRVPKYKHRLLEHFSLEEHEVALLCALLLRGPQTVGELRLRTERMASFNSLDEVQQVLEALEKDPGIVVLLPARPGQKERRFVQRLTAESVLAEPATVGVDLPVSTGPSLPDRVAALEQTVTELRAELQAVRDEFASFRKQFE